MNKLSAKHAVSFSYRAYDRKGQLVQGTVFAETQQKVDKQLRMSGLVPIDIKPIAQVKKKKNITLNDIEELTSQLSLLLKNGLKIDNALNILMQNSNNLRMQEVLNDVHLNLQHGGELWSALKAQESVFSPLYIEMVKIGETSGKLPEIFDRLAENLQFQRELNSKIIQAMIYPLFIFFVCIASLFAIFNFVVPSMSGLFESLTEIPIYTQILITTSGFILKYQSHMILLLILCLSFVFHYRKKPEFKSWMNQTLYSLPLFNTVILQVERIRYSASLELMLGSGVDLSKAMSMAINAISTKSIASQLLKAQQEVSQGRTLFDSLQGISIFDSISLSLLKVGEETGQLHRTFSEIHSRSRAKLENMILKLTAMIEPLMIIIMGGIVGSVVIIMLLSIVSINEINF